MLNRAEADQALNGHTPAHSSAEAKVGGAANDREARIEPSGLDDWLPILAPLRIRQGDVQPIAERAELAGVSFQVELINSGIVSEEVLFRALAHSLGIGYQAGLYPRDLLMQQKNCLQALKRRGGVRMAAALGENGEALLLIAPDRLNIPAMRRFIQKRPHIARRLRLIPPRALRGAVKARLQERLLDRAVNGLFDVAPGLSARIVVSGWQGALLGAFAVALPVTLAIWPQTAMLGLHVILSSFFLACVALRLAAGLSARGSAPTAALRSVQPSEMPVYTVLVALYREADIVPDLLLALGRIVWPRSKIEIKLVCESDDTETLAAIRAQQLRPCIEVIEVPPGGPRTKPKALSYALPMTSGEFVVLYDAEDKPHPFQLIEAWQRFRQSDGRLACLQAPLSISNRSDSWISAMFGFEYSALFLGLLPWLAKKGLVLPLGGTSNHFRRKALEDAGGWDPYNVTEDADLGLRLHRLGYRTGTITYPTFEDAPTRMNVWIPQRTRWFKGWAQTWLVHMRSPAILKRELGAPSFWVLQTLLAGMLVSALAYSVFLALTVGFLATVLLRDNIPQFEVTLFVIDCINIVVGHAAFLALGWWTLPRTEQRKFFRIACLTPVYWLMMSVAAWRAVWQLYVAPHHWEKTPHPSHRLSQARKSAPDSMILPSSSPIASRSRAA